MLIVCREGTSESTARKLVAMIRAADVPCDLVAGDRKIVIHVDAAEAELLDAVRAHPAVEGLVRLDLPDDAAGGYPFFPRQFFTNIITMVLALGALILLAGHMPAGLGERYDPLLPTGEVRVEWYFLPIQKLLEVVGSGLASLGTLIVAVMWAVFLVWPWLDRSESAGARSSRVARVVGTCFVLLLLAFGVWGALS